MTDIQLRLDQMEEKIASPSFQKNRGRANEVNYWVFDYDPKYELDVRERIAQLEERHLSGADLFF